MSGGVLGAIAGVCGALGGLVYVIKLIVWSVNKSEAETDAEIDEKIQKDRRRAEEKGRP